MRILIVEDEPGIATFVKEGLEEEGYEVTWQDRGDEGLKTAEKNSFDVLLLDWMLPGLSGIEISQTLRDSGNDTPIIFLTAKDTLEDTLMGLQAGGNDYIKKPFHFAELLERIKVQTRHKLGDLHLGKIQIRPQKHEVILAGNKVDLTQREYDLLLFLAQNKGKVCERKQIIEQVWDIHFDYNTSVIDVYINALRKKLNLKEGELIKTIRGVGYILEE